MMPKGVPRRALERVEARKCYFSWETLFSQVDLKSDS